MKTYVMSITYTDGSSEMLTKVTDIETINGGISYKMNPGGTINTYNADNKLISKIGPFDKDLNGIVSMAFVSHSHFVEEDEVDSE